MSSAPKNVPTTLPRPPIRLVPADDDGRDRLEQLVAGAGLRRARREERHVEESDDRSAGAADHVDGRLDAGHVDAGKTRRLFVSANRENVSAEARAVEQHGSDDDHDDHPDHRHRNVRKVQRRRDAAEERADSGVLKIAALSTRPGGRAKG